MWHFVISRQCDIYGFVLFFFIIYPTHLHYLGSLRVICLKLAHRRISLVVPLSPKEGSRNSMRPQRMIVIGFESYTWTNN